MVISLYFVLLERVVPAIDNLLDLPSLPEELEGDKTCLVVSVLEAGLAAGDHVELVICQFQRLVDPHSYCHTPLLRLLIDKDTAVVVLRLVCQHVDVEEGFFCAQAVAGAGRASGRQNMCVKCGDKCAMYKVLIFRIQGPRGQL